MKIPKEAQRIWKGLFWEAYEWDQEMFDGTFQKFQRLKRVNSAIIIPVIGDNIVICHEEEPGKEPFITFPAGRCDSFEEPPLDAAYRELLEETGYTSKNLKVWKEIPFVWADGAAFYCIAKDLEKKGEPKVDRGERITLDTVTFDQLFEFIENPAFRHREFTFEMLRMQVNPAYKEEFRRQLFGK